MAVVDSLEVEIQAKAKQANKEIDVLCSKLGNLSKQLASVDSKGLTKFSSGLNMLSAGMKGMRDTKMPDFTKTVKGLQKFETLDGQKLAAVSNALSPMANGLKTLGSVNFNNKNVNSMVSAVARLTSSIQGGVNTQGIISLGNGIAQMMTTLSSAGEVAPKTASFVNAISRLANAGSKTSASASGLPLLSKELSSFMVSMSRAPVVSKETSELTNAIARLASAGTRTKQTADNLDYLAKKVKDFMVSMQNAPQVSQGTTQLLTAIGNIASAGSRAGSALNSISFSGGNTTNVLSRLGNGFKSVVTRMLGFNKESKNIASSIGMFYAKFFMVIRGVKALGGAIGSMQDYIEEFNYFSVALDKVGKDSASQFKKAGYDSAEAYADSFRTRFAKLQTQMTGFNVDYDTGEATSNMQHNLGLDLTEVMNYNAAISQITNSAGMLGETSIATSKALSMLSADWSSLSNKDLSDVMDNFQSGLIGQSRALYQYGIDTTKAGLAQTALAHGISASVSSMSQQEKMQLRVLTMLEQSKVAYADLSRTINQPANQVRMLQAGLKNLSRTIGQIFLPVVQKLYPYLNAVVMVLQDFAQWVAKLTGAKLYDDTSMATPDYSDAVDGLDDYGDAADKASKKQKKLNDNLQGFDIVNKLQANNKDDGSSSGKKNGRGAGIDLSEDINKAVKGYESIWDKAFKSNKNKAVELAAKLKKAILGGWKKGGDYTSLGKSVGSWLTSGLDSIPWGKIQTTTNKLAKSLATFLNGMVQGINWETVGKTLANGFNTAMGALYTFRTTFDWLGLGVSVATGINSALQNADMTLAGKTLGAKVRGMIQFAFGLVTNFDFSGLGQKIADGINGFFEEMGEVRKNTGLTGWQELGKTLSDSLKGILASINTALSGVNWEKVGKSIGQFLGSIDWVGIWSSVGKTIGNAFNSIMTIAISALKEDPAGVIGALSTVFGVIFAAKTIKGLFGKTGFFAGLKQAATEKMGEVALTMAKSLKTKIATSFAASKIGTFILSKITFAKTAIVSLGAKISGAITSGLSGLSATGIASAAAPVLLAVGAAIGAGLMIGDRISEAIDAYNYTGDYEIKVPAKLDINAQKANEDLQKTKEYTDEINKDIKEINNSGNLENGKNIKELANRYYELSQKTNPTASDIAVMKEYSKQLSDEIPGLSKNIDKQTGAFKGNKDELNGLISNLDRAAKAQAAYNSSVELYEKKQETGNKLSEAQAKLAKYTKELAAAQEVANNVKKRSGVNSAEYQAQVKILGRYATKVNAARAEVNTLKKAESDINAQISKNNNVMDNAKVKTSDYQKASDSLKKTMKNLGVETQSSKNALKTLQDKLDNGEITWKAYKDVVDGNYKSVDELNAAIGKLTSKEVSVTAKTSGTDSIDKVKNVIDKLQSKTVNVDAKANVDANSLQNKIQTAISKVKISAIPVKLTTPSGKAIAAVVKATQKAMEDAFGKTAGLPTTIKKSIIDVNNKTAKIDKKNFLEINTLKNAGYKVQTYSTGGFPEDGLFMANHGELVGKFNNGKTTVANNEQITTAFAQAITNTLAPAIYAAVSQAVSENQSQQTGDVYLDGTKLTTTIMGKAEQITRSRGSGWKLA